MLATLSEPKTVSYQTLPLRRSIQVLAFRRQGKDFALPMSAIRELTTADDIVPSDSDTRLKGMCRIGGSLVPVLDLVQHNSVAIWESAAQLIVLSSRSQWIGLIYDQIVEICSIQPSQIVPSSLFDADEWPSVEFDHGQASYLDPARLVESPELALLDAMAGVIAYDLVG